MDLIRLAEEKRWAKEPLQKAAANAIFTTFLQQRLEQLLTAAKAAGYKRISIGISPDGRAHWSKSSVFAEPKLENRSNPLWNGMLEPLGGSFCGNGNDKFTQSQLRLSPSEIASIVGVYDL